HAGQRTTIIFATPIAYLNHDQFARTEIDQVQLPTTNIEIVGQQLPATGPGGPGDLALGLAAKRLAVGLTGKNQCYFERASAEGVSLCVKLLAPSKVGMDSVRAFPPWKTAQPR